MPLSSTQHSSSPILPGCNQVLRNPPGLCGQRAHFENQAQNLTFSKRWTEAWESEITREPRIILPESRSQQLLGKIYNGFEILQGIITAVKSLPRCIWLSLDSDLGSESAILLIHELLQDKHTQTSWRRRRRRRTEGRNGELLSGQINQRLPILCWGKQVPLQKVSKPEEKLIQ